LALEQRTDGKRDEEEKQEGIDACGALEVDWDDLGDGLELFVTLFWGSTAGSDHYKYWTRQRKLAKI